MKSFIQALIATFALSMVVMAAPVGICLHAYSPEAPAEKIECFEFEKIEKTQSGKRFFLPNGKTVIVTDYRNRGVVLYPAGLTGSPESLATLLATYETHSRQTPSTRPFLNAWILKLRNNQAEAAKQAENLAAMPSVALPDGTVLEGCKATRIVDDVVYLTHSYGTKKIKLADLSEASQKALKLDEIQKTVTPVPTAPPADMAKSQKNEPGKALPPPTATSPTAEAADFTALGTESGSNAPKIPPHLDGELGNFVWPLEPSPGGAKLQANGKSQPTDEPNVATTNAASGSSLNRIVKPILLKTYKPSEPSSDQRTRIEYFNEFQRLADKTELTGGDSISGLSSGMNPEDCYKIIKSYKFEKDSYSSIEFNELLKKLSYDYSLATGDILKSILIRAPKNLPQEIHCIALGFFNEKLYQITYVYKPQRYFNLIPKEPKYANQGDQAKSKRLLESWNEISARTLYAVNGKYTKTTKPYLNFFCQSLDPENISPETGTVLFHGVSKNAVAQITYVTQNESEFGRHDPLYTMTTLQGDRVIIANFYFLDVARQESLSFFDRKRGNDLERNQRNQNKEEIEYRKKNEERAKAAKEKDEKANQLRDAF